MSKQLLGRTNDSSSLEEKEKKRLLFFCFTPSIESFDFIDFSSIFFRRRESDGSLVFLFHALNWYLELT